jgi:TRAP-type mannitol/chloroaromatic compound transport system substrate-binding protein
MEKRVLAILLTLTMVLTLVFVLIPGCGGGTTPTQTQPTGTTPGQTTSPTQTQPPSQGEVKEWRCQTSFTSGSSGWWLYEEVADRIEAGTGGTLKVEMLPAGAIVGAMEVCDAVSTGAIEMGYGCDGYWQGTNIAFAATGIFGAHMSWDEMMVWLYSDDVGGQEIIKDLFAKYDIMAIPMVAGTGEAAYMSNKEIIETSDYEGLKFRGMGWTGMILNEPEFGAAGVMIPAGDVYTSLERGVVDACELGNPRGNWSLGIHEVTSYMGFPGVHQMTQIQNLLINMDNWNELTAAEQMVVQLACDASQNRSWAYNIWDSANYIPLYEEYGTEIRTLSPECQGTWRDVSWRLADEQAEKSEDFATVWTAQRDMLEILRPYITLQTPNWGD